MDQLAVPLHDLGRYDGTEGRRPFAGYLELFARIAVEALGINR